MITLAKYFSMQDFVNYFKKNAEKLTPKEVEHLGMMTRNFFLDLRENGILKIPQNGFMGHENSFIASLNTLKRENNPSGEDLRVFSTFLMYQIAGAYHFPGTLDEQYQNFIDNVNEGEFFDIDFPRADTCKKCGATLAIGAENWNFTVHAYREIKVEGQPLVLDHESVKVCPETH